MSAIYRCKYLTGRRFATFLKVADRIIPPDETDAGGGVPHVAGIADWVLDRIDPDLRKKFLFLLGAFEIFGLFFGLKPFSKLSPEARDRQLRWFEKNRLPLFRMGFFGLKTYACMGYYSLEKTWPSIGYGGPMLPDRLFPDETFRALQQGKIEVVA